MRKTIVIVMLLVFMIALTPVSASFPVTGTYISVSSGVAEPYSQFDNKIVLVEAFATWCEPCKSEMYQLYQLQQIYKDNLTILSLSVSPGTDTISKIKTFRAAAEQANNFHATWEFGLDKTSKDNQNSFAFQMNITRIPTILLVAANGSITQRWEGVSQAANISSYINSNVKFTPRNLSGELIKQIFSNSFFQLFVVSLIMLVAYQTMVPKTPESKSVL